MKNKIDGMFREKQSQEESRGVT